MHARVDSRKTAEKPPRHIAPGAGLGYAVWGFRNAYAITRFALRRRNLQSTQTVAVIGCIDA